MNLFRDALNRQLDLIREKAEAYDLSSELPEETLSRWRDLISQLDDDEEQGFFRLLDTFLEVGEAVGIPKSQLLSEVAVHLYEGDAPTVNSDYFRPSVPLPDALSVESLRRAMNLTQERIFRINLSLIESTGAPLIDYIQSNNYSGIISNILTDALAEVSAFDEHDDQEHPDLKSEEGVGLEIKAANRAGKGGESHNGHGGWHLVAGFHTDEETGAIRFVHIQVAVLERYREDTDRPQDWTYYGSSRDEETGAQRTETYSTTLRGKSKLRNGSIYLNTDGVDNWKRWQHDDSLEIPAHSPLYFKRLDNAKQVPSLKTGNPVRWSTVKTQLNKKDPLWPLYSRDELQALGLPSDLIDVIRPG